MRCNVYRILHLSREIWTVFYCLPFLSRFTFSFRFKWAYTQSMACEADHIFAAEWQISDGYGDTKTSFFHFQTNWVILWNCFLINLMPHAILYNIWCTRIYFCSLITMLKSIFFAPSTNYVQHVHHIIYNDNNNNGYCGCWTPRSLI